VTPEQFTTRCRAIWHVAPSGAWETINVHGLRTAGQLIAAADLDAATRERLQTTPRRESERLRVDGREIALRDQGRLFTRKDLSTVLADGIDVADWIRLLNRRVYLFTDRAAKDTLLEKYVERDGAQDVLTFSPTRLLAYAGQRLELADQNTGAIARRPGPQKHFDTFLPVSRFPDKKPKEVTVVDGIDDLTVVVRAERYHRGGQREVLER
jgi:hypothetical protein